jgi:thiol-disulfide isomerase/thioredoxin
MKKVCLLLVLFVLHLSTLAQNDGIVFFKGSWKALKEEAKKQNKMIYVDVYTTWCGPCKQMAKDVFPNPKVGQVFNANFINYKIDAEAGEGMALSKTYSVQAYPTSLFLNQNGDVIHQIRGSRTVDTFINEADYAITFSKVDKPIDVLVQEYKSGKMLSLTEAQLLFSKIKMQGKDYSSLFENYYGTIPDSTLNTDAGMIFVGNNIQSIDSRAFPMLAKAYKKRLGLKQNAMSAVMNGVDNITKRTLREAVNQNDKKIYENLIEVMTKQLAEPPHVVDRIKLDYAKKAKDTLILKEVASRKIPRLMQLTNEDLKKQSKMVFESFKMSAKMMKTDTASEMYQTQIKLLANAGEQATAMELNTLAWGYFEMINNNTELAKALEWSIRSNELEVSPSYLDTQAQLLFKLGKKQDAINKMKEAIKIAKSINVETDSYKQTLKKMK